jgi:hypothetical protein
MKRIPRKRFPRNGRLQYLLAAIAALCIVFLFAMVIYAQVKS